MYFLMYLLLSCSYYNNNIVTVIITPLAFGTWVSHRLILTPIHLYPIFISPKKNATLVLEDGVLSNPSIFFSHG